MITCLKQTWVIETNVSNDLKYLKRLKSKKIPKVAVKPPPPNNKREPTDDSTENNNDEIEKTKLNKTMHTRNGNRINKPAKERTHLKLVQINKGHAKYNSKKNLLHAEIKSKTPDIMILSEANVYPNDDTRHNELSNYNHEDKFVNNNDFARLTVMIKKGIQYERKTSFENDRCAIVIKVKISRRKWVHIVAIYRQWQVLGDNPDNKPNSSDKDDQVLRFEEIASIIEKVIDDNNPTIVAGDINIDRNIDNDPLKRPDIKALTEVLETTMEECSLVQMNWENTRHWCGKESLLDLFLTNIPQKINTIKTERCQIADHSTVSLQIHAKDLWRRPKIRKIRDWRKIQPEILMEAIENNTRLNSIFAYNDPDKIANILIEEYNRIINTLAPEKIIQVTKEDLPYFNKAILELKHEADAELTKAIKGKNLKIGGINKD